MATITTTINVCDRCGSQHNTAEYMAGNSWGQLNMQWHGDKGGRSYAGDAGGITLKGRAWLCEKCTAAFEEFMRSNAELTGRAEGEGPRSPGSAAGDSERSCPEIPDN